MYRSSLTAHSDVMPWPYRPLKMATRLCLETSRGILSPRDAASYCSGTEFLRHIASHTSIQHAALLLCYPELIRLVLSLFLHSLLTYFDFCEQIHFLPSVFLYLLLVFINLFLFYSFVFLGFLSFSFVSMLFSLGFRPFSFFFS